MDENEFFKQTVQHLARCLSNIQPTPWEKVSKILRVVGFCEIHFTRSVEQPGAYTSQ